MNTRENKRYAGHELIVIRLIDLLSTVVSYGNYSIDRIT